MSKNFASAGDLKEKVITFKEIGRDLYAFTAEGDPNSGIIIGDDGVIVIDAQATPVAARQVIDRVRTVTDKPIKYVVLSHYHAVRVLGASAYNAQEIIASDTCRSMIAERGTEDWESEYGRFPRLFQAAESVPGLTHRARAGIRRQAGREPRPGRAGRGGGAQGHGGCAAERELRRDGLLQAEERASRHQHARGHRQARRGA
jgi:hypothetical protein